MSWKEKLNRIEKKKKRKEESEEGERKRKKKELEEAAKRKAKFLRQVRPVIKKVIPRFLKAFASKKDNASWTWSSWLACWFIKIRTGRTIRVSIWSEILEPPYLVIFGTRGDWKGKDIKMFLKDINEESITNALIEAEKETPKLK